jgi:hypothetical protein
MRQRLTLLLFVLCFHSGVSSCAAQSFQGDGGLISSLLFQINDEGRLVPTKFLENRENPRLVAITLDVTLGLFGMHRLYLGTDVRVPIVYTLTFGGGGVLWLADLLMLIATPDITPYMNNPHFFMWIPPGTPKP